MVHLPVFPIVPARGETASSVKLQRRRSTRSAITGRNAAGRNARLMVPIDPTRGQQLDVRV